MDSNAPNADKFEVGIIQKAADGSLV